MKHLSKLLIMLGMATFLNATAAVGADEKELTGTVIQPPTENKVSVQTDTVNGQPSNKTVELKTTNQSELKNIAALTDLAVGDSVMADAEKTVVGAWKIVSLIKDTAESARAIRGSRD